MAKVLQHIISDLEATRELNVAFVIQGDKLVPEDVTYQLNVTPLHSWAKGETIMSYKEEHLLAAAKRRTGLWRISTEGIIDSVNVEAHFQYLLGLLEPQKHRLADYLSNPEEYTITFRIWRTSLGTAGQIDINSSDLGRICQLCHSVTIHYVGIEEEDTT